MKNKWFLAASFKEVLLLLREAYLDYDPRVWSNRELAVWGKRVFGDIINVSGWKDSDKYGKRYSDYFPHKKSYTVSNFSGTRGLNDELRCEQISFDLESSVPVHLKEKYDCVFNHTTLEHVYNVKQAVKNLCDLSKDLIIVVVPFFQMVHYEEGGFSDYWRMTPFALKQLFFENGFEVVYLSSNDNPVHNVYLFCVASRCPERWKEHRLFETDIGRCWLKGAFK